jgi:hypothetical protein
VDEVINHPTAAEDDRNADQDRYEQGHRILLGLLSKRYVNADARDRFPTDQFPPIAAARHARKNGIDEIATVPPVQGGHGQALT